MRGIRPLAVVICTLGLLSSGGDETSVRAQTSGIARSSGRAVRFAVSPPVSQLPDLPSAKREDPETPGESKPNPNKIVRLEVDNPAAVSADPVVQDAPVVSTLAAPTVTFDGLTNFDNGTLFGFQVSPPDTDGDVGPNHYVQIVNLAFRVYDKSGAPLTAAKKVSSLFTALGAPCGDRDDGDPIVLWDPLADRWLISQFCTIADPFNHQVIAISKTADPTGAYYLYDFHMPNNKFNDYPKFGVWPDGYYMTDNQFNQAGTTFLGAGVFAFDRLKMLAGDPSAGYIYFDVENGNPDIGGMLPADLDGLMPPPPGTPNYFAYFTADEFGDPADAIRIFEFTPNFVTPALSTFTERPESPVAVAAFDPRSPTGRDDIEQPAPAGATSYLDSISDRLMFRLAYRNFGTHESLVVNHTVNVSGVAPTTTATHQAGVRYYELRRSGGAFTVNEQATFAPDTDNRWMGSVAMDNNGNLAVGYSVSSLGTFPSIRYAGRLATDPPNGLFQGETSMQAGSGVQRSTGSRWGDYSAMSVDPIDDCTFWYTTEYYTAASEAASTVGWLTRIGSFSFPSCTPAPTGTISGTVTNVGTGLPIPGAVVTTTSGFVRTTDAAGAYSFLLPAATYTVMATAPGYLPGSAPVTVGAGGSAVQNFALTPIPILMKTGTATLTAESCGLGNGAVDPGESVTVSLSVVNSGPAPTVNLVGTLLPGGGVTMPGPPQTFGVVAAGGGTASRTFTFVASAALTCGAVIDASLQLQDGTTNFGTFTYPIQTGVLNPFPVTTMISSGDLSVPIPDVSSVDIPIVVPDGGSVTDVNVSVRLNHTFDGDLDILLIAPDGTTVPLSNRRGGAGDDFGTGATSCAGTPTVFDDSAPTAISAGAAPFAGAFRPEQPLSAFNGKSTAGTWRLRVVDLAALDTGSVFCVKLEISRRLYACCGISGTPVPQPDGFTITGESCSAANGAADPDETVTASIALRNAGSGDFTNLVATLLPGGGVATPGSPQTYGPLFAGAPPLSRSFTFVPQAACSSFVTATLHLQDGATDYGNVSFLVRMGTTLSNTYGPFANAAAISIPAGAPGVTSGAAAPYPSPVTVSGIAGTVSKVKVKLTNMNHTFPDDIDVLLVGPSGQSVLLMSDAGGSPDLVNVTLTFDDSGSALPDSTAIATGTYQPTNYGAGDTFPVPAPAAPYGAALSVFNGTSPNGTWNLFVVDDAGGDSGNIGGGWSIDFETADPACCSQACTLTCPGPITRPTDAGLCNAVVNFPGAAVQGTCGTLAYVPPTGSVFPLGTSPLVVTSTSRLGATTGTCSTTVKVSDLLGPSGSCVKVPSPLGTKTGYAVTGFYKVSATDTCSPGGMTIKLGNFVLNNGEIIRLLQWNNAGVTSTVPIGGYRQFYVGPGAATLVIKDGANNTTAVACPIP